MDIREQFHRDEYDRVLFFTAPPLDVNPIPAAYKNLGHSVKYLARVARDNAAKAEKAAALSAGDGNGENGANNAEATALKRKREQVDQEEKLGEEFRMKKAAAKAIAEHINKGTQLIFRDMYGHYSP